MGCHFLLQEIFPTQVSNPGVPHCRQILCCLSQCSTWMQFQKRQNDLCSFPKQTIHVTVIQVHVLTSNAEEAWSWKVLWIPIRPSRTKPTKDVLFITGDWNAKAGSQETPRVTGKFGLGVQNETGQRLIEFYQGSILFIENTLFQQHKRRLYTWTHQMANSKIRLTIFFAVKEGEALYSQKKQDWELNVAQIMNSLLPNSDWNWRK